MDIYTQLEDSVYNSIDELFTVLGKEVVVIHSHSNAPEPTSDYVAITVLGLQRQGYASKSGMTYFVNGQAREYATQPYEATVQLDFIGANTTDLAMLLHSQYRSNSAVREHFLRNKLAPRTVSDLRYSPQMRGSSWVKAFSLDMKLAWTVYTIQDVDWVDYVVVNDVTIPLLDK